LNVNQFISMDDAREKIEAWRIDYNGHRPDSSLGNLTLSEFAAKRQEQRISEVAIFWFTSVHQRGRFMLESRETEHSAGFSTERAS
jgi:hypothetical protein